MNKKFAIALALSLIAIVCCAGCIDPQDPVDPVDPVVPVDPVDPITPVDPVVPAEEYSVIFMLNYGEAGAYTAETVTAGNAVAKPTNPTRSGYTFKGWFTVAEGGAEYDFTQAVNADLTLYAQWKKKSSSSSSGSSTPKHTHSYTAVVTEPTCTTEGYTTYSCGGCGDSYTADYVGVIDHPSYEQVLNSESGSYETKCAICGTVVSTSSVEIAAMIGAAGYPTIDAAVSVATSTQTVILMIDVEDDVSINKQVIIDGNKRTVNLTYTDFKNIKVLKENSENVTVYLNGNKVNFNTEAGSDGCLIVKSAVDTDGNIEIYSVEGLRDLATSVNDGNSYSGNTVKLMTDLDLNNEEWTPIGTDTNPFNGVFDGQNYKISNLKISGDTTYVKDGNNDNYKGLFGYMIGGDSAAIKNVVIENADVSGCLYVGSILGRSYTGGVIEQCHLSGDINIVGYSYVGGIVGRYEYSAGIYDCSVKGTADNIGYINGEYMGATYVGGIVGFTTEPNPVIEISDVSVEYVTITGATRVGGITGISHQGCQMSDASISHVTIIATQSETIAESAPKDTIGLIAGACQGTESSPSVFSKCQVDESTATTNGVAVTAIHGTNINGFVPCVIIDGVTFLPPVTVTEATQDALNAALAAVSTDANTVTTINVPAGTYTFPTSGFLEGVTLVCDENTVFEGISNLNINGATVIGATFKNDGANANDYAVTGTINGNFKDCIFESNSAGNNGGTLRWCYSSAGTTTVFENCVIKSPTKRGVHFDGMNGNVIFIDCDINGFNAYSGDGTMIFEGCTFGYDGSNSNGLNIYSNTELIDCTFNFVSGKQNFIDMEGTGKTLTITNCKATLDGVPADIKSFIGGSKLAQNTVYVDSTEYVKS